MRLISILFVTVALGLSVYGQQMIKVGATAPEFSAQSINGQSFDLSQLQGKVVLLTFWSTRCEICHSEIPKLNQVVEHYRNQNVVFIALTMENEVKVEPYLKKNPFNFNIIANGFGVVLKYADTDRSGNINMGFPAHFLINKHGAVEVRTDGWDKAANIDSQIARMLASE